MSHRQVVAVPCAAVAAWLVVLATAWAAALPEIPDKLKVPAGQTLAADLQATGVQIYVCAARKDDATKFEWTLKAPEAELFDAAGKKVVKHYGGPTWEADDGSKVVGELKARDDSPDPNAIPWLLLTAKSVSGSGMLGKTVSIQRLQTVGGKAPADGCSQAAQAGSEVRVAYQARYAFYTAKP
jgi:hypothetical protein